MSHLPLKPHRNQNTKQKGEGGGGVVKHICCTGNDGRSSPSESCFEKKKKGGLSVVFIVQDVMGIS